MFLNAGVSQWPSMAVLHAVRCCGLGQNATPMLCVLHHVCMNRAWLPIKDASQNTAHANQSVFMYLIRAHGAGLKRVWKQRLPRKVHISSRFDATNIRFLQTVCILLVVINLVWICYNMSQTTYALKNLEETYHLRKPREWEVALDDV